MNFKEKLKQQLSLIEHSCKAFDQGIQEEALQIATRLRVIFHDTTRSTSILKLMNVKNKILMVSSIGPSEDEYGKLTAYIPSMFTMDGVTPQLESSFIFKKKNLPVEKWWNEIIFIQNGEFSRRDVVLSATNQDGGAHVAERPNNKTKELKKGIGTFKSIKDGTECKQELIDYHFQLLRQIGFEVLNSPELVSLTQ